MPGLFGCVGVDEAVTNRLRQSFERIWQGGDRVAGDSAILGGHAFGDAQALRVLPSGLVVALDGEPSLYTSFPAQLGTGLTDVRQLTRTDLRINERAVGNIALMSANRRSVVLMNDWSGTFPLYYASIGRGVAFSSLLAPLAGAINADPDELAVLEYLRNAYTTNGRTLFRGVRRLLPGQILRFSLDDGLSCEETSPLWTDELDISRREAKELAWQYLLASLDTSEGGSATALMISGGWDSRTLLAGLNALRDQSVVAYSHGDTGSREFDIVRRLCSASEVPLRLETIDERIFDPDLRAAGFSRVENMSFPYWQLAGQLLEGQDRIVAGIYGEVLGGHYGPAMLERGIRRASAVALPLLTGRSALRRRGQDSISAAHEHLQVRIAGRHWYLRGEFEESLANVEESLNASIDSSLRRLRSRGIDDPVRLIEAYITEHRGVQYIAAQLLSCRAYTDVAFPFAHPEMLRFASALPFPVKVHNVLNRAVLLENAPELLDQPMAATLLPARAPVSFQETSRALRKVLEHGRKRIRKRNGRPPRLGWVNFDFLRGTPDLERLVESLNSPIWDRTSIRKRIARLESAPAETLHPFFDQFSKVLTVDMMLSAARRTAMATGRAGSA